MSRFFLLIFFTVSCFANQPLLEALKNAITHISSDDWDGRLDRANIEPADNNIIDRLISRLPVQKDISLKGLLFLCEKVERDLPENGDFNAACLKAIGEQLHDKSNVQTLLDWIWGAPYDEIIAATPPPSSYPTVISTIIADEKETAPEEVLPNKTLVVATPAIAHSFHASSLTGPNACLNITYLPYMDWVYYASLHSLYSSPLLSTAQKFISLEPHYLFAKAEIGGSDAEQSSPGFSLLGGKVFREYWILGALFDYGHSNEHWRPDSGYTKDTTQRFSLASSLAYRFSNAFIQGMLLGMYNYSKISNPFIAAPFSLNHWGFGARLDAAIRFHLSSTSTHFGLQPYFCFDYFLSSQKEINSSDVIYVKKSQFFQTKGLLQFYAEFFPYDSFSCIPQAYIGFGLANAFSRTEHQAFCDTLPSYPNWRAALFGGEVDFIFDWGLLAKGQIDATLCHSVQIYSANLMLGWKW